MFFRNRFSTALVGFAASALLVQLTGCAQVYPPSGASHNSKSAKVENELRRHVFTLAETIGEHNVYHPEEMARAAAMIEREFRGMGYTVHRQAVVVPARAEFGVKSPCTVYNLEAVKQGAGTSPKTLVIGAHYDTRAGLPSWHSHKPPQPGRPGTPGANDNGSGVAALLAIARELRSVKTAHTIRFVAYANEEPPFFGTDSMGSRVHARDLVKQIPRQDILGMISLETLGCYSPRLNTKRAVAVVPAMLGLPNRSDYVAFLSTSSGKSFSKKCACSLAQNCPFEVRTAAVPYVSKGVAWSDDWAYMKEGIPAFAATDTAYLRCDDYHELSDTPEKLDYPQFAEVTSGLSSMVKSIAGAQR
jgi:hypothetical protein